MPIVAESDYQAPWLFRSAHLNTIYAGLIRKVDGLEYVRTTMETPDDDFMDLDWVKQGASKLLIAVHGLEGASDRAYIRGALRYFHQEGWDGLGMNFRTCSGRMNRQLKTYNMGASDDLALVVEHAVSLGYQQIGLVGFSLGGNVILKYLGEKGEQTPKEVKAAVAISVPCHIPTANIAIAHWQNRLYLWRFLRTLNEKLTYKAGRFPDELSLPDRMPRSFREFDDHFTGPVHGYLDGPDYWDRCSSTHFIPNIRRPALLINAQDDTFLSPQCFPFELARAHPFFHLETPQYGGHVGFVTFGSNGIYWSERRALEFLQSYFTS